MVDNLQSMTQSDRATRGYPAGWSLMIDDHGWHLTVDDPIGVELVGVP